MKQFEDALLFKCIVDNQSLVKAAQQSGLNASAVSKRLAKLEKSLRTQLIKRTTRRLALTEAGHYFYEKVSKLQHEWVSAVDETTSLGKDIKGVLRIAAPQPLLSRFLMPLLAEFHQHYPAISLELLHEQIDQLPLIDADISISREITHYDSNSVVMTPLYHYHNRLFASPTYLDKHPIIKNVEDLQQHRCLVYKPQHLPASWSFETEKIILDNTLVINSADVMISAAKSGLGIIYLPEEILREELKQQLVAVLPHMQSPLFKTCAYYPKVSFVPQKVRALLDFLKQK